MPVTKVVGVYTQRDARNQNRRLKMAKRGVKRYAELNKPKSERFKSRIGEWLAAAGVTERIKPISHGQFHVSGSTRRKK